MIEIRRSLDRGHADRGWLKSRFTFSFADYHDPDHMGFRVLRVINEDYIEPGKGFGPHAHRDMEIITYILDGTLLHRDSMGEMHSIGPNEIQTMSAGSGIVHSEVNPSDSETVHLLQIWIEPSEEDLVPAYQQIGFDAEEKRGRLRLLGGPDRGDSKTETVIRQNVRVYAAELSDKDSITTTLAPGRFGWIQVARGRILVNDHALETGDGAAISQESQLTLSGRGDAASEFIFFDLP
jgi:redox-sensitive bicupin YhaK (pirin superfamily)